jgi:hypothetical protein
VVPNQSASTCSIVGLRNALSTAAAKTRIFVRISFPELSAQHLSKHSVWRFTNDDADELELEPAVEVVFSDLSGLVIGTHVTFADGSSHWGLIQNISFAGPAVNDHFVTLSVHRNGEWFPLARYHDIQIEEYGPNRMAAFMGKPVEDVFPIVYDLREVLNSASTSLVGAIRSSPLLRLTEAELISLALDVP